MTCEVGKSYFFKNASLKLNSDFSVLSVTLCWSTKTKRFGSFKNYDRHAAAVHAVFGDSFVVQQDLCQWSPGFTWAHCVPVEWCFGVTCACAHNVALKGQLFWDVQYALCTVRHSRTNHIGVSTLTFASFSVTDALTRVVLIVRDDDANLIVEICKTVIGWRL